MGDDGDQSKNVGNDDKMPPNEASALNGADGQVAVIQPKANGDMDVDIEGGKPREGGVGGMTKEELMKYANDPFWVRLRWFLFILFWVIWVGMVVAAIAIIVLGPKCVAPPKLDWWQKETIYQVYPRSFQDSNDDGVGDIKGIKNRLGHLEAIGAKTVWLSPVYKSPMKDFGYDVADYRAIDETFGTMDDFDELLRSVHKKGMYLVMDFIPNHSSDQHEWFNKSIKREDPYTDYYVWVDGTEGTPPTNWMSVFGGSAWTWNRERGQYYYHQFLPEQPDLNFRNPDVVKEMEDVLKFWVDKGVDGFRIDALKHLFESETLADEPRLPNAQGGAPTWSDLDHVYTTDQPEVFRVLSIWRDIMDKYKKQDGKHRLLMAEVYDDTPKAVRYYGNGTDLADFPFNFLFIDRIKNAEDLTGTNINGLVEEWMEAMPNGTWANWVTGNHDQKRVASRLGDDYVDAMNMITLMLPGTPVTYYGEELGMTDTELTYDQTVDPQGRNCGPTNYAKCSRDPARTPMQWDSSDNAGFSKSKDGTWLPVNPNYMDLNVKDQSAEKNATHLNVYKALSKARKEYSVSGGNFTVLHSDRDTFAFVRAREGSPGFLVAVNFAQTDRTVDLSGGSKNKIIPEKAEVVTRSIQATNEASAIGKELKVKTVPIGAREGIVLKFELKEEEE